MINEDYWYRLTKHRSALYIYFNYYITLRAGLFYSNKGDRMKNKTQINQNPNNEPCTFELVLAERDYKGDPTGRMKELFTTTDVNKLTEHYGRNSGGKKRKKKPSGSN